MKILYVASQTDESETLALEREVTDVQRQLLESATRPASIVFMPDMTIEALPIEVARNRPDILHISVHGDREGLWFSKRGLNDAKSYVHLTPARLFAFLDPNALPRLIFLNACKSIEAAEFLSKKGVAAIGTSAPITNDAAIAASRLLYERLLGGRSIADAFAAVDALVSTIDDDQVNLALFMPEGVDPTTTVLHSVPRLAARLAVDATVKSGKPISIELGIVGCHPDTRQVVFFTDDTSFITDKSTLQEDLCEVICDTPRRGEIWTEFQWRPAGNFRAAACGITAGGVTYSVSGMVVDALKQYAELASPPKAYMDLLVKAVAHLHKNDGSGLVDWESDKVATPARSGRG